MSESSYKLQMAPSDIDELLAKLETAPEGSHQLDYDIAVAVGDTVRSSNPASPWAKNQYSQSMDHAVSLVPEGWTRGILTWPGYENGKLIAPAKLELHHEFSSGGGPFVKGYGATRALAASSAALKAHTRRRRPGMGDRAEQQATKLSGGIAELEPAIAAALREAAEREREACAQLCDDWYDDPIFGGQHHDYYRMAAHSIATSIRARGEDSAEKCREIPGESRSDTATNGEQ